MKLNISCDKEDCCLTLEYCASCAGGDHNIKYLKDETKFPNKKTPGCRGCGWDGPSIAGVLEACLNCQTGKLPKREIDKSKETMTYMRSNFPAFDKFYRENEAQIEYLLSIQDYKHGNL